MPGSSNVLRGAVLSLVVAVIALAAAAITAIGAETHRPSKAEAEARYQPTLRNHQGVKAPHVCEQRGYYVDDQGTRHPTGGNCTDESAPLHVRVGELLSVRTARAATKVVITSLDYPTNHPLAARACRPRYIGVWTCRMPSASSSDRSLRISIAYPKARGNWTADVVVSGAGQGAASPGQPHG